MSERRGAPARRIAVRYVGSGRRSRLVSFMSLVSVAGIAFGTAALITVLSVMNGFDREMRESILGIVPHLVIASEENLDEGRWRELAAAALEHPQVESAVPVIRTAAVAAGSGGGKAVQVVAIDPAQDPALFPVDRFMRAGSLDALAETRWGVVIGARLAERLGTEAGGSLTLYAPAVALNPLSPRATFRRFRVVGVFRAGADELDGELAVIALPAARALFRPRGAFNSLRLRVTDVLLADRVRAALLPRLPATATVDSWTRQLGAVYSNIRFSRSIIGLMLWLLAGVAAFNLVVSLVLIVRDKRGDIAILRALGAAPGAINRIFIWQGCLIGGGGVALGVALGVAGALHVGDLAAWIERRFSIDLLNAEVYPIDYLPSEISGADIAAVAAGVMLLSLLATLYPARRAAAVRPAEVLGAE